MRNSVVRKPNKDPLAWWQINPPKDAADALKFGPICYPLSPEEAQRRECPYVIWFDWMPASPWRGYSSPFNTCAEEKTPLAVPAVCKFWQASFDFVEAAA